MTNITLLVRKIESTIEFITNSTSESEVLMVTRSEYEAKEKLWAALRSAEAAVASIDFEHLNNPRYRAILREFQMSFDELTDAWLKVRTAEVTSQYRY